MKSIKSSLNGAAGDSFFLIFVRMVTLVFSLLMTRILSGHFSVYDYGTYSQIILLSTTVTTLTILGMTDGLNYFFCREKNEKKRDSYVATLFALQVVVGMIAAMIVLACTIPISKYFDNPDLKKLIIFAAALPFLQNTISLLQIMFIAIKKAKLIAIRNLAVSIFKLIGILLACYLFDNIAIVFICQVILELFQIIYFFIILRRNNYKINIRLFDRTLLREIFKYCIPMAVFTIVKSLNKDCDKLMIAAFTDTETLALYTNASKQLPFDTIMITFCTVLIPYFTRYIADRNYIQAKRVYKAFLELSYISTNILAFAAICTAPEVMDFLYTAKYLSGIGIFIIYILVDVFSVMNLTLLLSAAGKTKTIMSISLIAFASNIGLNFLCYYLWGWIGPAIATLIVTAVQGVVMLSYSSKLLQTSIFEMFNKRFAILFVFEAIAVGTLTYSIRLLLLHVGLPSFIVMCVCCFIYILPMLMLNFKRLKKNLKIINSCKI